MSNDNGSKKKQDSKKGGKDNSGSGGQRRGRGGNRRNRPKNRRRPDHRPNRGGQVHNKGELMSVVFFDGICAAGDVRIYPGSLRFRPVNGQPYDVSVRYYKDGRIGKALPQVPDLLSGDEWLSQRDYLAACQATVEFRRRGDKLVGQHEGWTVILDRNDAKGRQPGRYLVQLSEQATCLIARCLVQTASQEAKPRSQATFGDKLGDQLSKLDDLLPSVRQKVAVAPTGVTNPDESEIQVTEKVVNVFEKLGISEQATRREIEAAFAKAKAKVDPASVLKRLGDSVTATLRMNLAFGWEALCACREKALAILERRTEELKQPVKPSGGAKLAKKAVQAAQSTGETRERMRLTPQEIRFGLERGEFALEPGQHKLVTAMGKLDPTVDHFKRILRGHDTLRSRQALALAKTDPQLPLVMGLFSPRMRLALERSLAASAMARSRKRPRRKPSAKGKADKAKSGKGKADKAKSAQ